MKFWSAVWVVLVFAVAVLPLLAGLFYSEIAHVNANDALAQAMSYTYPYAGILIPVGIILWTIVYFARRRNKTES